MAEEESTSSLSAELIDPSEIFSKTLRSFLAPVQEYLDDPSVVEIMINGPDEIFIERLGRLIETGAKFENEEALVAAIRNLLQYVGKRLTADQPMIDARLPDGSRVHVAMPPCSRKGPCVTIRKFKKEGFDFDYLVQCGTVSRMALEYLRIAIQCEKNLLFAGGTSSGKTSLLNSLGAFIPPEERVVVIEESTELQLTLPHVLQLETRGPDRYGRGEVTIRDLFRNSLRMRPDRIIVGEVRGGEALDLIQALTSGHGGSMSTMHADTPQDALNRLETMALMSDVAIPLNALRTQIASSIDLVIEMARFHDASRRVIQISEVLPVDGNYQYRLKDIFLLKLPEGSRKMDQGRLEWTGERPALMDEVQGRIMAQETESLQPFFADKDS
ncbi:MAG: CpaF family protein [Anaerolineaceae bacterium]|nr:CpaF family protein [Anaerolineaceae bacterium]